MPSKRHCLVQEEPFNLQYRMNGSLAVASKINSYFSDIRILFIGTFILVLVFVFVANFFFPENTEVIREFILKVAAIIITVVRGILAFFVGLIALGFQFTNLIFSFLNDFLGIDFTPVDTQQLRLNGWNFIEQTTDAIFELFTDAVNFGAEIPVEEELDPIIKLCSDGSAPPCLK